MNETVKISPLFFESFRSFTLKLVQKSKSNEYFVSPLSIYELLLICYSGSRSQTRSALRNILGIHEDHEIDFQDVHRRFKADLKITNKLYLQIGKTLDQTFSDSIFKNFEAEIDLIDFKDPRTSRDIINKWVNDKTNGKIPQIIESSSITKDTRLVLVNAVYFQAPWLHHFDPDRTSKQNFTLQNGSTTQVDMMQVLGKKFRYANQPMGLKARVCELPYKGNSQSMTLILPDRDISLETIENELDLTKHIGTGSQANVNVHLPKFKINCKTDVRNIFDLLIRYFL